MYDCWDDRAAQQRSNQPCTKFQPLAERKTCSILNHAFAHDIAAILAIAYAHIEGP